MATDDNIEQIKKLLSPEYGLVLIKYTQDNHNNETTVILKTNDSSNKKPCISSQTEAYLENDPKTDEKTKEEIANCLKGEHYLLRIDIIDDAEYKQNQLYNNHTAIETHIKDINNILKQEMSTIPITISNTSISTIIEDPEKQLEFSNFLFQNETNKFRTNIYSLISNEETKINEILSNLNLKTYSETQKKRCHLNIKIIENINENIKKNINKNNDENNDEKSKKRQKIKNKEMFVSIIDYSNSSSTLYSYLNGIENIENNDNDNNECIDGDNNNDNKMVVDNDKMKNYIKLKNNILAFYISLFKYKGIVSFDGHLNNILININDEIVIIDYQQFQLFENNMLLADFKGLIEIFNENTLIKALFELLINKETNKEINKEIDKHILEDLIILLFIENVSFAINHEKNTKFNSYLQLLLLNYNKINFPTRMNNIVFYGKKPIEQLDLINTLKELSNLKDIYFPNNFVSCDLYNSLHSILFPQINSKKGGFKKTRKYRKKRTFKTPKHKIQKNTKKCAKVKAIYRKIY